RTEASGGPAAQDHCQEGRSREDLRRERRRRSPRQRRRCLPNSLPGRTPPRRRPGPRAMKISFSSDSAARAAVTIIEKYGYTAAAVGTLVCTDCPALLA